MEQEKEEEENKKVVNKTELAELTRLNTERERVIKTSKRMKYKAIGQDVVDKVKQDALDYILALAKKYNFNPALYGVDRVTGEIRELPESITGIKKKNKK